MLDVILKRYTERDVAGSWTSQTQTTFAGEKKLVKTSYTLCS